MNLIGISALLAVVGSGGQSSPAAVETVSGFSWTGEADQKVEVVGVCTISSEKIECWSPDGSPNAALAKRLSDFFTSDDSAEVWFVPGRKNRYIVYSANGYVVVKADGESKPETREVIAESEGWSSLRVVPIATVAGKAEATLSLRLQIWTKNHTEIPFKKGAKGAVGGFQVELGAAQEIEPSFVMPVSVGEVPRRKAWSVDAGVDPVQRNWQSIDLTPVDSKGRTIEAVDRRGDPAPKPKGKLPDWDTDAPVQAAWMWPKLGYIRMQGVIAFQTNVNPARIASVRITKLEEKDIVFSGILLDPKR